MLQVVLTLPNWWGIKWHNPIHYMYNQQMTVSTENQGPQMVEQVGGQVEHQPIVWGQALRSRISSLNK